MKETQPTSRNLLSGNLFRTPCLPEAELAFDIPRPVLEDEDGRFVDLNDMKVLSAEDDSETKPNRLQQDQRTRWLQDPAKTGRCQPVKQGWFMLVPYPPPFPGYATAGCFTTYGRDQHKPHVRKLRELQDQCKSTCYAATASSRP